MRQKLVVFVVGLSVLIALGVGEVRQRWAAPLPIPQEGYILVVEKGDSLRKAADRLHKAGILPYPQLLALYGRWTGLDQQIKRGEYLLAQNTTAESLLTALHRGDVIQYHVTLPEGITLASALDILAAEEKLERTLTGGDDAR